MVQTGTELPIPQDDNEAIKRPENWISNADKNPYSPGNMMYQILAEKGFHISIDPSAVDNKGKESPHSSAVFADNPEERAKVKFIQQAVIHKPLYMLFYTASMGAIADIDLANIDLTAEEKKQLKVLSLKHNIITFRQTGNTSVVEEKQRELDKLDSSPYPLQQMRDNISKMIDEILAEHPEQKP